MIVWNAINQSIGILHFHYSKLILSEKNRFIFAEPRSWGELQRVARFSSIQFPWIRPRFPSHGNIRVLEKNINYNIQIEIIHCTKLEVIEVIKYDRAVME